MPSINEILSWGLPKAVPLAIGGLAGSAALGFLGSRGELGGAAAGVGGGIQSASGGAFTGAFLGGLAGAGITAAGMYAPVIRPAVGKFLTKVMASRPIQKVGGALEHMTPKNAETALGFSKMRGFINRFATPQENAVSYMIEILEKKQADLLIAGGVGVAGGAIVGGAFGGMRGAYQAGARRHGPMGATY